MARIRSIKPEVWNDPEFVSCSTLARLLWIGSWNHADDYGVLKDDPGRLKLQILPADDCDPHALVGELVERRLLLRRVAPDGTRVLVIRTFSVHQKIDRRAAGRWGMPDDFTDPTDPPSRRSAPPDRDESPPIPTDPAESPAAPTDSNHTNGGEGKGRDRENVPSVDGPVLTIVPDPVSPPATDVAAERFEEHFWPIYPKRNGKKLGKRKALALWKRLKIEDQRDAVRYLRNYAAACDQGLTIAKDGFRWLRDRDWDEWKDPAEADSRSARPSSEHAPGAFPEASSRW